MLPLGAESFGQAREKAHIRALPRSAPPISQPLDRIANAVAQGAAAAHQSGEVAGGNPAQGASRPMLVEALGLAAQHVAIALAARDDGSVGAHRGGEAGDVGHGEELLEARLRCRTLGRSAA